MSFGFRDGGRRCAAAAILAGLFAGGITLGACRRSPALAQSESPRRSGPEPARLDGQERVEWDQAGKSLAEVQGFRYMAVIGQWPRDVEDVRCEARGAAGGPFVCSGKLPPIPHGVHQLRLIAVAKDGPKNLISRWSAPVLVEKR
ncbi:MAG TPA: hypothetical protein VFK57_06440 [Vicinamibacterales bacterium]|nr:hypothetical protein [Vicinamibacterales bacterium]